MNMDYAYFFSGISFIILAIVSVHFSRMRLLKLRWRGLILFAMLTGLNDWFALVNLLDTHIKIATGFLVLLQTAAYLSLVEFARRNLERHDFRIKPPIAFLPFVLIFTLLLITGLKDFYTFVNIIPGSYAIGFIILLINRRGLSQIYHNQYRHGLNIILLLFGISLVLVVPDGSSAAQILLAESVFRKFLILPVQVVRGTLILFIAFGIWIISSYEADKKYAMEHRFSLAKLTVVAALFVFLGLYGGWSVVKYIGDQAKQQMIRNHKSRALMIARQVNNEIKLANQAIQGISGSHWIGRALQEQTQNTIVNAGEVLQRYNRALNSEVCYIVDTSGSIILASDRDKLRRTPGNFYRIALDMSAFHNVRDDYFFSSDFHDQQIRYTALHKITNDSGALIGLIAMQRNLGPIFKGSDNDYEQLFLVNPDQIIFSATDDNQQYKRLWPATVKDKEITLMNEAFDAGSIQVLSSNKLKDGQIVTLNGRRCLVAINSLSADGWKIVMINSGNKIRNARLYGILITLFVVIALVFLFLTLEQTRKTTAIIAISEKQFRNIFENASDGILIHDDKQIIDCNKRASDILLIAQNDLKSATIYSFIPDYEIDGTTSADTFKKYMELAGQGEPQRFTMQFLRGDQSVFDAEISMNQIKIEGSGFVQMILRDISAQKQVERDLKAARDRALDTSKIKSEFLANMSHEIRTPLNGVIGMLDLLSATTLDEEQSEFVSTAKTSAESLLYIINDILDFSKIEAGKMEVDKINFNLYKVIEEVTDTLAKTAHDKNVELISNVENTVPINVIGDPVRVRQVLMNLTNNAIKFTDEGEVEISCRKLIEDEKTAWLKLTVRDTGIGISEADQAKIFESFQQADGSMNRKFGGTGLGLAISRQLVELMHGHISLTSELGRGSAFSVVMLFEKGVQPEDYLKFERQAFSGKKILIIDDNRTNQKILKHMIKNLGISAEAADSGAEGLAKLSASVDQNEPFHLILLDVQMPGMDGRMVIEKIRQNDRYKQVKIVVLTSSGIKGESEWFSKLNCSGYLSKPVKTSQLIEVISETLDDKKKQRMKKSVKSGAAPSGTSQKEGRKILLVEDNRINQMVAQRILERVGFDVEIAENGKIAVEKYAAGTYDLILMDVQMPEMNGFDATMAIRKNETNQNHIPIIAMTAHAMKGDREKCLAIGMDDYISKPVQKDELIKKLNHYINLKENT